MSKKGDDISILTVRISHRLSGRALQPNQLSVAELGLAIGCGDPRSTIGCCPPSSDDHLNKAGRANASLRWPKTLLIYRES